MFISELLLTILEVSSIFEEAGEEAKIG